MSEWDYLAAIGQIEQETADALNQAISAVDLMQQTFPPLAWAVPGIIPEGLTMLVGPPKTGKSWLALAAALGIADGGQVLAHIHTGAPRPVLYFALEDGVRRLQDRCRELLAGGQMPKGLDFHTEVRPGQLRPMVEGWLSAHPGGVVFLDTFGKVRPIPRPQESPYQADYAVMSALKQLTDARPGSSLVLVHHTRKAAATDFVDKVSGTHGLSGAADTTLLLSRERGASTGLLEVTGRDVPEGSYALTIQAPGSWQLDGDNLSVAAQKAIQLQASTGVSDTSVDVIAFVARHPEGVRPADVEAALGMPDARRYLSRLAASGRLQRPKRGLYMCVPTVPMSQSTNGMGQRDSGDRGVHPPDDSTLWEREED